MKLYAYYAYISFRFFFKEHVKRWINTIKWLNKKLQTHFWGAFFVFSPGFALGVAFRPRPPKKQNWIMNHNESINYF